MIIGCSNANIEEDDDLLAPSNLERILPYIIDDLLAPLPLDKPLKKNNKKEN